MVGYTKRTDPQPMWVHTTWTQRTMENKGRKGRKCETGSGETISRKRRGMCMARDAMYHGKLELEEKWEENGKWGSGASQNPCVCFVHNIRRGISPRDPNPSSAARYTDPRYTAPRSTRAYSAFQGKRMEWFVVLFFAVIRHGQLG